MSKRIMTPSAAMEAKRLYAILDERGRRQHSMMDIAAFLGVGETTVYRAIHAKGAYMGVRELPSNAEASASEAAFRAANPELFGLPSNTPIAQPVATETRMIDKELAKARGYIE